MSKTAIEWATDTWNPTTGCDRVSPGCDHCYALTMAKRLKGMGSPRYQRDGDPVTSGPGFGITEHRAALDGPLRWTKPRRIFVNSMSDLFHAGVSNAFLAEVFAVMAAAEQHTFQVLTKRHARMRTLLNRADFQASVWDHWRALTKGARDTWFWPLPNVWLGVSVEDQKRADLRIPALLDTPAAVRFLSCEPLVGPVDLLDLNSRSGDAADAISPCDCDFDYGECRCPGRIDWVIAGGESGPGARPMHPDWARSLRDQCVEAQVPFFFKQWGEWSPEPGQTERPNTLIAVQDGRGLVYAHRHEGAEMWRVGKHASGRELDGRTWDEYPTVAV